MVVTSAPLMSQRRIRVTLAEDINNILFVTLRIDTRAAFKSAQARQNNLLYVCKIILPALVWLIGTEIKSSANFM